MPSRYQGNLPHALPVRTPSHPSIASSMSLVATLRMWLLELDRSIFAEAGTPGCWQDREACEGDGSCSCTTICGGSV